MDRRSFLKGASTLAGAAAIPFSALNARAQDPSHQGGICRGQTAGVRSSVPGSRSDDRTRALNSKESKSRRQSKDLSLRASKLRSSKERNPLGASTFFDSFDSFEFKL